MKHIKSIVAAAFLALAFAVTPAVGITAVATLGAGCASSPHQAAFKAADVAIGSVDTAMKAWADYVVAERRRIKALPDNQAHAATESLIAKERQVSLIYRRYQDAVSVAQVAVNAALDKGTPLPRDVASVAYAVLEAVQSNLR